MTLLEARDRVGGRILTRREPDLPAPLELGAEFAHGSPRQRPAGRAALVDAPQRRWILRAGKLRGDELFPELKARLGKTPRPRRDLPFAEFLEGPARRRLPPRIREFALMLVEGSDAAFFHAPRTPFPTFWTMLPVRASLLTAWAAGPAASQLAGVSEEDIVRTALRCLTTSFSGDERCVADFQHAYVHGWQADPFACGAYSYVVAGGGNAREVLARPLKGTLFFAGEAADTGGESGTVAGELDSAKCAVEQLLASLGN